MKTICFRPNCMKNGGFMEYNYQNSVDDFRVKYTLVIPDAPTSSYQLLEQEQEFLEELEEAYSDIERLTNQADGYDYALAVSSGIVAGLIDAFFVGEWNFAKAKGEANKEINKKITSFAKKDPRYIPWCEGIGKPSNWVKRNPDSVISAVEFLEEKYVLPGDNDWKFKGSGISPSTHHLDDFCHHPTLIGMICCILVQFTGNAKYHTSTGNTISLPIEVNEYGNFVSEKFFGKIFAGIINWFLTAAQTIKNQKGHIMSDMAGSKNAVKGEKTGSGIPGTVMSTLKELSALPCFKDTDFAENLRKAFQNGIGTKKNQLDLGVFNNLFDGAKSNKFDARTELAVKNELKRQAFPVYINEIIVRAFYFIRRFIVQMKTNHSLLELDWKKALPINNRTIVRMITVASGTLCLVDLGDAAIRAGKESGGSLPVFFGKLILRVNFVGIGRFTLAVGTDVYMDARKGRLEIATASGEIAVVAIEEKKLIASTSSINRETDRKIELMKSAANELDNSF